MALDSLEALADRFLIDPRASVGLTVVLVLLLVTIVFARSFAGRTVFPESVRNNVKFAWNCFFKPHTGDSTRSQQDALESFYKAQASVYDATRMRLLQGREEMLGLVAAQAKHRVAKGELPRKPTWVDVGGGTGYNIEQMGKFIDVPNFFDTVYLVDLSPSLCAVAEDRFQRLGWKNVRVLCQDARSFRLSERSNLTASLKEKPVDRQADVITMSYSLSMIPDYYSVVDSLANRLTEHGIFGVADFYVQSEVDYQSRNYIGGEINRHCMWISRVFWRTWFEADRVSLEAARRDYLEYRFGTILSVNERCHMFGLRIPYYVWVGCAKDSAASTQKLAELNAVATESPYISAIQTRNDTLEHGAEPLEIRSKAYESAVVNLAASLPLPPSWYQSHHWRIYYDDTLKKHRQFNDEYIYAFTWEDSRTDARILKLNEDDVVLAITSAGDNILAYALENPKRIHAVDLNPSQNHLLELKLAAFTALPYEEVWCLFGEGKHPNFKELLVTKLSPHLSSLAFQYWLVHGPSTFSPASKGLYYTGGSRHALKLVRWLFYYLGLQPESERLCSAQTLAEQREIWHRSLRRVLLSKLLSWCIVSNKTWLWKALGVPNAQREMIERDFALSKAAGQAYTPGQSPEITAKSLPGSPISSVPSTPSMPALSRQDSYFTQAGKPSDEKIDQYGTGKAIWAYAVATLDPVVNATLLSNSNHYYLLCLLGKYLKESCPEYLTQRAHARLSRPNAFDGVRIHTDEVCEVVERMKPGTLTVAVVMDSMDWFEPPAGLVHGGRPKDPNDVGDLPRLRKQIQLLRQALKVGGRVMLRSAGQHPWYIEIFAEEGFKPKRINVRTNGACVDRVNMYASTWICTKLASDAYGRARSGSLEPLNIGEASIEEV